MAALSTLIASTADDTGGWGLVLILATVLAVVIVIGAVWRFAARRGSRMPESSPHRRDHGVRGS